ncbi:ABC-2 family transporter protein [Planctomycetes bacterium Pan216]|uniref:ABC-2 family transporter protein n=1 Tax=Kolteria novifilia TaxID=2527975 RepID=A0A518B4Q5_9BACT|nr:ABC-2 family transporter protein [Planctomycetes bacterium Pan216]
MFLQQMLLEWRIQRRRPLVWFCFLAFFSLALSDTMRAGWSAEGHVWINGAGIITNRAVIYSLLGVAAVAGIMSDPMTRDRAFRTEELVLTAPVDRITLGLGRFLVAFLVVIAAAAMFIPGMLLGTLASGIPPEVIGPTVPSHYAKAMGYFLIPNYFLLSALVFLISSRWQSKSLAFGSGIGALALWVTCRMMLGRGIFRQEVFSTYALLDPFGSIASFEFVVGRTVAQNNVLFPPLDGLLFTNRLIWIGVGCLFVVLGVALVPMRPRVTRLKRNSLLAGKSSNHAGIAPAKALGPTSWQASEPSPLVELVALLRWELMLICRQPSSKICLAFAAITIWWSAASSATYQFSLPSTDLLVHTTSYYFRKTLVLAIVWIASELIWRDQSLGVNELIDVQPSRDSVRFLSKTLTLVVVVVVFWMLAILVNISYQLAHGYVRLELGLYLTDSFIFKVPYYLFLAVLALSIQAIVRHRYIAIGIVLLVYVSETFLDALHWYHPLVRYGRVSHVWYSLMDGYGHFWKAHRWMLLYWSLGAVVVWLVGWGSYSRGTHPSPRRHYWRHRLLSARGGGALLVALSLFLGTGGYIWFQSTVNATWPPIDVDATYARVEATYGEQWRGVPQPRIVAIEGDLELIPSERRFELKGAYVLENQSEAAIEEILVLASPGLDVEEIAFDREAVLTHRDEALNIQTWRLSTPMEPGTRMEMSFRTANAPPTGIEVHAHGDGVPDVAPIEVIGNGTSLLNLQIMPAIGYTDRVEHKPAWKRRRYGLPKTWAAPSGDAAISQPHATLHLGWVESFEMVIHTAPDQTALHAGVLVDQWIEPNGRRGFRYRADRPTRGWSGILSGRYVKKKLSRDRLPDVEVFVDPQHVANGDFFGRSLHDAMEHFTNRYGPPPFETFRLGEQSLHYDGLGARGGLGFSSEVLGWKTDIDANGGEDIKRMAAVMMGLNWFGDQIIPANVAGAKVIHAGFPYWAASLYLHQHRDPNVDRRLRAQDLLEMFRGRGEMTDQEAPFAVEFKDSTLIRKKGSVLILYLAHLIGAEELERIIGAFLEKCRYRKAPYPTAAEFLDHLRAHIPEKYHPQLVHHPFLIFG